MMKRIGEYSSLVVVVLLCTLAPASFAQDEPVPNEDAAKAFDALRESYLARPALGIKSSLQIELKQGDQVSSTDEVIAEFTYVKDGPGLVRIKGYACRFEDGEFLAVHEETDDAFYRDTYEGSPYWMFLFGFQDLPYPHLALLWGEPEPTDVYMQLHGQTPMLVPMEVEDVEVTIDDAPAKRRRIRFTGVDGTMEMLVDPDTKLIDSIRHEVTGGGFVRAGTTKTTTYDFEYTIYDEAPPADALAIDTTDRQRVDLLFALQPKPEPVAPPAGPGIPGVPGGTLVGKPAPNFVLATAGGEAIDLADLEGKVVVLDFWATWCPPCRKALPKLHEVARWAREEALPVEILTINVWEARDPANDTPDKRLEAVNAFWTKNGYTLPVAMDYTDATARAYGVRGIPATFVLRSDGVVHGQPHADVEMLKQSIRDAIEALEAPDDGAGAAEPDDTPTE